MTKINRGRARPRALAIMAAAGPVVWAISAQARPVAYLPPPCPTVTFHTQPGLAPQRVCMNLGVSSHGIASGSYLFVTPHSAGAGIFKNNGTLVWWKPLPPGTKRDEDLSVVRLWGHPYLAVWSGQATSTGSIGTVSLYDEHYRRVGLITAPAPFPANQVDLHEFRVTPQGDALIGIWETVPRIIRGRSQSVIQYVVQKLSLLRTSQGIRAGRVLFQWDSLNHVPARESHEPDPGKGVWDYFHGNSVAQDTDGNLLVSGRNTWGIYKISIRTGRVIWEVGGRADHTLKEPWCDQHDVTPLGHNRYTMFDDGGSGTGCETGISAHASRAIEFRVIPGGKRPRVAVVHTYTHRPATTSAVFGSVQALAGGHLLADWGSTPEVTDYDAHGRVDLDLSLSAQSYRAFEFPWVGRPTTPPAVAAAVSLSGTHVWASWNGATEVVAWRVLAGTAGGSLRPVTGAIRKAGFETSMPLMHRYAKVAVQALGPRGQVLGTSRAVAPTAP